MRKILIALPFVFYSIGLNSQSLPELIKNGQTKLSAANYEGAAQDFSNAIKVNEPVVDAYLIKMKNYSTLNEYQRSTSDMPDGFIYSHDHALAYYGRGLAYEGLGKSEEALADFEKAVNIDPKYAEAMCRRGMILIAKGTKDKGCMDLRKAKSLGYEEAKTLYDQNVCSGMSSTFAKAGDEKFEAKDYPGALADYTAAIQLNSDSIHVYIKRAQTHIMMKKFDKAIADYNKALRIKPDTVKLMYLRGLAYNAAENYKLAFNDLSQVIKLDPNCYDAFMNRAAACEGMQNYKSAIFDYSEAIRVKPKEGVAYYKRALANQDAKDDAPCKDFLRAASLGCEDAKINAEACKPAKPK
ncbi:MAG: tetratricopeptide repeat protein [Bacteroidota bacterium]|nr:tetratricopeptide repeat protein [Bacteroidota bacterium]